MRISIIASEDGIKIAYISVAFGLNIWYPIKTLKRGAGQPVQKLKIRSGWVVWPKLL
jgi:hypothetical protein